MDTEIEVRKMECKEIRVDVRTASIKESTEGQRQTKILFQINHTMPFTDEYNQMINYYNKRYLTQYNNLSNCMIDIKNIKHSQQEGIQFKTKKIVPRGFTYQILFNENINIPLDILYIGIGNFNFIGGGELET